eukprot:TRINITY_DN4311_c0_g1_i1.p1 TRINITY_DN4311_c0_g1~~TRINITY_DN4311_c0_g1_i1.p1  ORF type:complete len:701 (+),score=164.30 TRINITY_DN4311_c0_g1_i1:340-2442(+)
MEFHLYNLTNVDQVNQGMPPIYQQCGPYVYRKHKSYYNVTFPKDGEQIQYKDWTRYHFQRDRTTSNLSEIDLITNINPAYMGVIALAGSDSNIMLGLTGPTVQDPIFTFFYKTLIPDIQAKWTTITLSQAKKTILSQPNMTEQQFYEIWANSTSQPDADLWKGLLVSSISQKPSQIPLPSCLKMWNPSSPYSLTNHSTDSIRTWRRAIQADTHAHNILMSAFNISVPQITTVLNWLNNSLYPEVVNKNITYFWNIEDINDLAYLQWGQATPTQGVSVMDLYPEANFTAAPEFALFPLAGRFSALTLKRSKFLLSGPSGLFSMANTGVFLKSTFAGNVSFISSTWGLSMPEALLVAGYLASNIQINFTPEKMASIQASGGGLFTTRTVHEWLWNVDDPLVAVATGNPSAAQAALVYNTTTLEEALKTPFSISWTGKNNISRIAEYVQWKGGNTLTGYSTTVPIVGVNDFGQFQPNLDLSISLSTFDSNFIRTVELVPIGMVNYKGIKMIRYEVANKTLDIDPFYFQNIRGFANMSYFHNGSTVFLSNPHMYGAESKYVKKIQNMTNWQDVVYDTTVVDIEPNLGTIMNYDEGLQVNIYLSNDTSNMFSDLNGGVVGDVMLPVMIVKESSHLTDADVTALKGTLYRGIMAEMVGFWVLFGIGSLFIMISLVFWFILWIRRVRGVDRSEYSITNPYLRVAGDD